MRSRLFIKPVAFAVLVLAAALSATNSQASIGVVDSYGKSTNFIADTGSSATFVRISDNFTIEGTPGVAQGVKIIRNALAITAEQQIMLNIAWTKKLRFSPSSSTINIRDMQHRTVMDLTTELNGKTTVDENVINLPPGNYTLSAYILNDRSAGNIFDFVRLVNGVEVKAEPGSAEYIQLSNLSPNNLGGVTISTVAAKEFDTNYVPVLLNGPNNFTFSSFLVAYEDMGRNPNNSTLDYADGVFMKSNSSCVVYPTKAEAAANDGCISNWEYSNLIGNRGYAQNFLGMATMDVDFYAPFSFYFSPASVGPFSVTGSIKKVDKAGNIVASSKTSTFSGNASYLVKPEYKQEKTAFTTLVDNVSIDFNRQDTTDYQRDPQLCSLLLNKELSESLSKGVYIDGLTFCNVVFDHIPAGLVQEKGCADEACFSPIFRWQLD